MEGIIGSDDDEDGAEDEDDGKANAKGDEGGQKVKKLNQKVDDELSPSQAILLSEK